jgi:hypothetical protein
MKLTGHKTVAVYQRNAIVAERDLREALVRTEDAVATDRPRSVVPLAAAREGRSS